MYYHTKLRDETNYPKSEEKKRKI